MGTKRVYLDFGSGEVEVSSFVQPNLVVTKRAASDSYHYAQGIANFTLNYDLTIFSGLRNATSNITVRITDNDAAFFYGIIPPQIDYSYNGMLENIPIQLEVMDSTQKLDVEVGSVVYRNYTVMNPSIPSTSIVHQLAAIAGLTSADIDGSVIISTTYSGFSPNSETDSVLNILDTLLFENGYVLNFDENNKLKPIKWINAVDSGFTFDETNIIDKISVVQKVREYEGVELTYYELAEKNNIRVYTEDLPYNSDGSFAGYSVLAGTYYPVEANVIDETTGTYQVVYQEYSEEGIGYFTNKAIIQGLDYNYKAFSSDFSSIVATSGHVLSYSSDTLTLISGIYENKRAQILLKNNTASPISLYYLTIDASVLYKTSERKSSVYNVAGTKKVQKYSSEFIFTSTTADLLTKALAKDLLVGNIIYSFTSSVDRSDGTIVTLHTDDGTNQLCFILEKTYQEKTQLFSYKLKGYSTNYGTIGNRKHSRSPVSPAQATASTAYNEVSNIYSPNILSKDVKPYIKRDYDVIISEQTGIDAQATFYGITTEKTNYDTSVSGLTVYLTSLSPAYTDFTTNTTITGTTFQSKFNDVYTTKQLLFDKINEVSNTKSKTWEQESAPTISVRPNAINGDYWVQTSTKIEKYAYGGNWVEAITELAKLGITVVSGGYIKTNLIDVTSFNGDQVAARVNAGTTRIEAGKITISKTDTLFSDVESDPNRAIPENPSSYHSFDDVAAMPDDPAGTTYANPKDWPTIDGWLPNAGAALTVSGGELIIAPENHGMFRRDFYSAINRTYRLKIWTDVAHAINISGEKADNSFVIIKSGISLSVGYNIIDFSVTDGVTYTGMAFTGGTSPSYRVADIYIGTGAYLPESSIDNSGHGLHERVYGATPVEGKLVRDGINDYGKIDNFSVPDIFVYREIWNGSLHATMRQTLFNIGAVTGPVIWAFRTETTNNLLIRYWNGSAIADIIQTNFFLNLDNTDIDIAIKINFAAYTMTVYQNGEQFGAVLPMTTPVKPAIGTMYFGSYQAVSYWASGIFDNRIMLNYDVPDSNVRWLYINKSLPKKYTIADWHNSNASSDGVIDVTEKQGLLEEWKGIWNKADRTTALPTTFASITTSGSYMGLATMANNVDQWTPTTAGTAAKAYYDAIEAYRAYIFATPFVLLSTYWNSPITITAATWASLRSTIKSTEEALRAKVTAKLRAATTTIEGDCITTGNIKANTTVSSGYNVPVADRGLPKSDFSLDNAYQIYRDEGTPVEGSVVNLGTTTCAVVATSGTYIRNAGSFITDGLVVGGGVRWTGFANAGNNSTNRVTNLSALICTCSGATGLVNETAASGRSFYPIDTKFRKMEIGPTKGLLATDGQGRIIHDIASQLSHTYSYPMGHLYLNTMNDVGGTAIDELVRTYTDGNLFQVRDIDLTNYVQHSNSKGVHLSVLVQHKFVSNAAVAGSSALVYTYFVAGGTASSEYNLRVEDSEVCPAIGTTFYFRKISEFPVSFVSGKTIRVHEILGFLSGAVTGNEITIQYRIQGEYI